MTPTTNTTVMNLDNPATHVTQWDAASLIQCLDAGDLDRATALLGGLDTARLGQLTVLLAGMVTLAASDPQRYAEWLRDHTSAQALR